MLEVAAASQGSGAFECTLTIFINDLAETELVAYKYKNMLIRLCCIVLLISCFSFSPVDGKRKWYRIDQSRKFNDFVDKYLGGCIGSCNSGPHDDRERQHRENQAKALRDNYTVLCAYDKAYNENSANDCKRHNEDDCRRANCCWQPNTYNWCVYPKWGK